MCDLGVASCHSQHQCHFWRIISMLEAYCIVSLAAVNQIYVFDEAMNSNKTLKYLLKACFENVNMCIKCS